MRFRTNATKAKVPRRARGSSISQGSPAFSPAHEASRIRPVCAGCLDMAVLFSRSQWRSGRLTPMAFAEQPDEAESTISQHSTAAPLDRAAQLISLLADYGFVVACVEALGVASSKRSWKAALVRLGILGGSVFALNTALKRFFAAQRPPQAAAPTGLVRMPSSASFPSGHTMAAAAAAVALPATNVGIGVGLLGAGAVGWSRLHLGAHHGRDVVGGLAIGAGLGAACRVILRHLAP